MSGVSSGVFSGYKMKTLANNGLSLNKGMRAPKEVTC